MIDARELLAMEEGTPVVVVSDAAGNFQPGDVIYRRHKELDDCESSFFTTEPHGNHGGYMWSEEVAHPVPRRAALNPQSEDLGIFRPDIETRKVGKVRVELLDDGFPLALREIAKVMTWAQTAKGYKDHDWQNLPDAEIQLAAAASRHRTDHIAQRRIQGLNIEDCVDSESGLLHKAHEAFGVLAQLEMMLRGKF